MASVKKEDERIERVIRGLLKLPGNKRCINCNLLGPQYVCTTFSTFVCTNCSGIHREFTHRVKSVSMAKFTSDEVAALQAGGNERAKQIYFKEWDPQCQSYPDSRNTHRLRDFIKNVYVDRKFTGERNSVSLSRLKLNEKEESNDRWKIGSFRFESISPQYEDRFERQNNERFSPSMRSEDKSFRFYYDERRSPRKDHFSRHGSLGRRTIKFEVVDDRFRDDDDSRSRRRVSLESKLKQLKPGSQKNVEESPSPSSVAHPEGDVPGENTSSTKVGEPSQAQHNEAHDFAQDQVMHSSGKNCVEKNPSEQKVNPPESFTDLSTKPQASDPATGPETQPISQSSENNWASFEDYTVEIDPRTSNSNTLTSSVTQIKPKATYVNSLDLLISELSGPLTATTGGISEVSSDDYDPRSATIENTNGCGDLQHLPPTSIGKTTALSNNSDDLSGTSTPVIEMEQTSNAVLPHVEPYDRKDSTKVSHVEKLSNMQFPPSVSVGCSSKTQPISTPVRPVASNNLPSDVLISHDSCNAFPELSSQTTSKPAQDTKPDVGSQPRTLENKSSGRKELPEDLFATSFLSGPAPLAGWQNVQPRGLGYGLQYYPNAVQPSGFPMAAKSTNPFEVTEGRNIAHASSFPSLASLQGVLPAASPRTGLMHSSSVGSMSPSYASPIHPGSMSPSYASPIHPGSTFASGFPSGAHFGQVGSNMQRLRPESIGSFNGDRSVFGSLGTIQPSGGEYMAPRTPNSFSKMGGNPFGNV